MSNVIEFRKRKAGVKSSPAALTLGLNPVSSHRTATSADPLTKNNLFKINELEEEILTLVDDFVLNSHCTTVVTGDPLDELPEKSLSDLAHLTELVVFSPEIQQEGFARSAGSSQEHPEYAAWGDVFIKVGDEYPFLFTVYTKPYVRNQLLRYGEKILPSSKDIVLNRKHLQGTDIIRAVIKWTNLYGRSLMGRPIALESYSILQTLVCDPFVEIQCPDSAF